MHEIEKLLTSSHVKEQVLRFVRVFCFALIPQLLALPPHAFVASTILSVVVAAAETAYRQVVPVVPLHAAREAAGTAAAVGAASAAAEPQSAVE